MLKLLKRYDKLILFSIVFYFLGYKQSWSSLGTECANPKEETDPELSKIEYAVLILSSPSNIAHRQGIRETWIQYEGNLEVDENKDKTYIWSLPHRGTKSGLRPDFIKFFFVIGTKGLSYNGLEKLKQENIRHLDLLFLEDLEDSYDNLTEKLLRACKWLSENLIKLKYVVKCDDDSFVRIDLIIHEIEHNIERMTLDRKMVSLQKEHPPYKGLYWGYFKGNARVFRNGKWEEKRWFLCDHYLPYALGGGYVVSKSIVDYIARNADMLSHYNSEDVSMGVWTSVLEDINRIHDVRFDTQWKSRGCLNHMLIRHKQTPAQNRQLHNSLIETRGEKLCPKEEIVMRSYFYDWTSVPSGCCAVK